MAVVIINVAFLTVIHKSKNDHKLYMLYYLKLTASVVKNLCNLCFFYKLLITCSTFEEHSKSKPNNLEEFLQQSSSNTECQIRWNETKSQSLHLFVKPRNSNLISY